MRRRDPAGVSAGVSAGVTAVESVWARTQVRLSVFVVKKKNKKKLKDLQVVKLECAGGRQGERVWLVEWLFWTWESPVQ